jgi:unsaturated rhamnogalacturonyl hydrolase
MTVVNISIVLLIMIAASSLAIFSVDLFFWLKEGFCRFHIGRWTSDKRWLAAIKRTAIRWSSKTPTVKITDNRKLMLIDMIYGKYRSSTIQSWQTAAIILGLLEEDDDMSHKAVQKSSQTLLLKDGNWRNPPTAVDCGMLSYALLKATDDVSKVKPAMDFSISIINDHLCEDGMICYTKNDIDNRYVDTLGLVCPFLALYARIYDQPEYELLAYKQIEMFRKYGLLEKALIPNHAYNAKNQFPVGVYGWGRGVAWYLLALMDTFLEMKSETLKQELREHINPVAESLMQFQQDDGGFGSIIQLDNTYDSSATSVVGYFYSKCYDIFLDERYLEVSEKCLKKLKAVTRITGEVDWCQGDTKGIGVHSKTFDIMPFAQGMTLRVALTNKGR